VGSDDFGGTAAAAMGAVEVLAVSFVSFARLDLSSSFSASSAFLEDTSFTGGISVSLEVFSVALSVMVAAGASPFAAVSLIVVAARFCAVPPISFPPRGRLKDASVEGRTDASHFTSMKVIGHFGHYELSKSDVVIEENRFLRAPHTSC